jgi:hypothetical protein
MKLSAQLAPGHRTGIPAQPNLGARPRGVAQQEAMVEPVAWPCDLW